MSCPPFSSFILDPPPPCLPYRHLRCDVFGRRVKVRLIFMLYFNLLIVSQGSGLLLSCPLYTELIFLFLAPNLIQLYK